MDSVLDVELWRSAVVEALRHLMAASVAFLPKLVGALLIIAIGWGLSRFFQTMSRRALTRLGFDQLVARLGLADSLRGWLKGRTLSEVVSRLLFWILLVTFLLFAADTLGVRALTVATNRLVAYLPRILGAALLMIAALVLGRLVRRIVESGAALGSIEQAPRFAKAANAAVVLTGAVLAIEQLGVATEILVSISTAVVATLGLAMGIAFALGARGAAGHVLAGHFLRQRLPAGDEVEIDGVRGVVEVVGTVDTVVRAGEERYSYPNSMLLDLIVKR